MTNERHQLWSLFESAMLSIRAQCPQSRFVVAFSGGMDSHVLLSLSAALERQDASFKVRALHVNHGLQAASDEWESVCVRRAISLGIDIQTVQLKLNSENASEALARHARYSAFKEHLAEDEVLLTGHHARDQAETFFLRLMRKSGVAGLSSMRTMAQHHGVTIYRPLLNATYHQLTSYAESEGKVWVSDPSNLDVKFDRNYLRHSVLPVFENRWPNTVDTVCNVASYCQEAELLLLDLGRIDYRPLAVLPERAISISDLLALPDKRAKNALFAWIRDQTSEFVHQGISTDLFGYLKGLCAKQVHSSKSVFEFKHFTLRLYRGRLFYFSGNEWTFQVEFSKQAADLGDKKWPLVLDEQVVLREPGIVLTVSLYQPGDILEGEKIETDVVLMDINWLRANIGQLFWRLPRSGDRFFWSQKPYPMKLKKLWQEQGIPPWNRYRYPVLVRQSQQTNGLIKEDIVFLPGVGLHPMLPRDGGCEYKVEISFCYTKMDD